jgi:hypothetical protein
VAGIEGGRRLRRMMRVVTIIDSAPIKVIDSTCQWK